MTLADPQSRLVVITVFTHVVRPIRPSVPTFQNLVKQNKCQVRAIFTIGETVCLAEWIIDAPVLFKFYFFSGSRDKFHQISNFPTSEIKQSFGKTVKNTQYDSEEKIYHQEQDQPAQDEIGSHDKISNSVTADATNQEFDKSDKLKNQDNQETKQNNFNDTEVDKFETTNDAKQNPNVKESSKVCGGCRSYFAQDIPKDIDIVSICITLLACTVLAYSPLECWQLHH